MDVMKFFVFLLLISVAGSAWSHHHHGYYPEHGKENGRVDFVARKATFESEKKTTSPSESLEKSEKRPEAFDDKGSMPFSERRLEKMLEKAILKIITGDLSTADMLLLKSLNYSREQVLAIRKRELDRQKDEELRKLAEFKSNGRHFYNENLYGKKAKQWKHNSMEFRSSSRNDPDVEVTRSERKKNRHRERTSYDKDFDFDAYNRQAVIDYENLASNLEQQQSGRSVAADLDYEDESRNAKEQDSSHELHRNFDRAMEPHVVFKIRYDDSEFDSSSGSDERSRFVGKDTLAARDPKHRANSTLRHTTAKNVASSFHASSLPSSSSSSSSSVAGHTPLPVVYQLGNFRGVGLDYHRSETSFNAVEPTEASGATVANTDTSSRATTKLGESAAIEPSVNDADNATKRKMSEYEGLEWVEDDVYRVMPAFADSLGYDNVDEDETAEEDYEEQNLSSLPEIPPDSENDAVEYQNDAPDSARRPTTTVNASIENASSPNLSTYQQLALAHRRDQGQKAIEDIKTRVLALTGRFNHSTNTNHVQRERLTMFSPTCQIPRNTDSEAWTDPFSMNLHFQLNLTSSHHVVAAKLRIYKLPQENLTTSVSGNFDEDEDDEKKIRISVYYYTKSLKKHRSKKRLMDSVVTPLKADGTHLVLDVKQGLTAWKPSPRNPHGNHGLVIRIEDQDDRSLKPALYIQQPSCGDHDSDQKAFQRTPALFVRACTRYVRVVNGRKVTYVNCRQ